jgi:phosphatidylglycerophosphate synthase
VRSATEVPPLPRFLRRNFAARSPFWSWLIFEPVGGALAWLFARLQVTPAVVTVLGGVSGVAGAATLAVAGSAGDLVVAAALLLLAYAFDCADGQLARATGRAGPPGAWLDVTVDAVVLAFVSAAVLVALLADDTPPLLALLIAGGFGAARTASLFTSSLVRSTEDGGMKLDGVAALARAVFVAMIDTPWVYLLLCMSRADPRLFRIAIAAVGLLTVVQTAASAYHYFAKSEPRRLVGGAQSRGAAVDERPV